ncbi:MAG TPA: PKD domain-containing protein [Bacteroidales bacterium]|jgi:PKD repeat protein|nr:PKD domain-containing protein [Bacteroidales bacterium]OQB65486.1 MAG: PKD domain protein [Bacteroidetes bacterium ADurb.Bin145]HQG64093.1 PKD domain-containing protein [Bacteroidales bacterium]
MKKSFYLILLLPVILFSCESFPEADFRVDLIDPEVGEEVCFTNRSHNAVDYEWDFGDGYISYEPNPVHIFTGTGSFQVILTAYSPSGESDQASIIIDVMVPTLLEIEVREYYDDYIVPDASVRLYPTLPDWEDQTNMETEGYTDQYGIVVFSHLGPYVYYTDIWEENHDNYDIKDYDISLIRTPEVIPHKINRFIALVDYVEHGKGERTRDRTYVIKKLERNTARTPVQSLPTDENWQELYKRSIRVK